MHWGGKEKQFDIVYEGVLVGNKYAGQHNLKTVKIREIVSK